MDETAHIIGQHATARHAANAEIIQLAMHTRMCRNRRKHTDCSKQYHQAAACSAPRVDIMWSKEVSCLPACDRLGMSTAFQPPCLPTKPVCTSYTASKHGVLSETLLATCIHDQTTCCDADGTVMLVLGLAERLIVLIVCAETDCRQVDSTSWRGGSEMQQCC